MPGAVQPERCASMRFPPGAICLWATGGRAWWALRPSQRHRSCGSLVQRRRQSRGGGPTAWSASAGGPWTSPNGPASISTRTGLGAYPWDAMAYACYRIGIAGGRSIRAGAAGEPTTRGAAGERFYVGNKEADTNGHDAGRGGCRETNAFSETKFQWLRRMEGCLQAEVFDGAGAVSELDLQYPADMTGSCWWILLRRFYPLYPQARIANRRGERRV